MKRFTAVLLSIAMLSCVSRRLEIETLTPRAPVSVRTAVKAHLNDGSTVIYPRGVTVTSDALVGAGTRHDVLLSAATPVSKIPLSEVLGMETFRTRVNAGETAVLSTLAAAGAVVGTLALAVAIFGSCPTVYSAGGDVEEAELFASSIAPLLEGRDIDRLRAVADAHGRVDLEIRNEAMETHYINHLELLEVRHAAAEQVVPDTQGVPIVVRDVRGAESLVNRDGRDLRDTLAGADGRFYQSDARRLGLASAADMEDWIDLSIPVDEGRAEAAIVFRMRNSLLNTILLYDVMLGRAGAAALDWLGEDLERISTSVELGRWHQLRAGLHVSVWQDGAYREVARVPDSGPLSWHDVAAVIRVPSGEKTLRVRLSSLADHWRIDRIGVSFAARPAAPRGVPVTAVLGKDGRYEPAALANLRDSDDRYLQTNPGQLFVARFEPGPDEAGSGRTFLLSSQGYYTEWIRGAWIRNASAGKPFIPSDTAILEAIRKWRDTRDEFERRFMTARVPVR